jgi:hypothetical protein
MKKNKQKMNLENACFSLFQQMLFIPQRAKNVGRKPAEFMNSPGRPEV